MRADGAEQHPAAGAGAMLRCTLLIPKPAPSINPIPSERSVFSRTEKWRSRQLQAHRGLADFCAARGFFVLTTQINMKAPDSLPCSRPQHLKK
jgi:hypothetical protein